ncbi:MAG: alpha/beta hydrolase [Candidatus Atribacteria bacterium]|nr:alpha/beta hydrolase [Candidatus Atribacteria bacterium]
MSIMSDSASMCVSEQEQSISFVQKPSIEGIWEGKLIVPGTELRIVCHVTKKPDGTFIASLDSPDQGVKGIPVEEVIIENRILCLQVKTIGGFFEGKLDGDYLMIEGEWKQSGASFPLTLKKVDSIEEITKPQDPQKPYPYLEEEVIFENKFAGIKLAGTLTLPDRVDPSPCVILISGSGPQDRNETIAGHRPFLILADYLTRQGIAVLRFDDRGVGESTGDFSQATSEDFSSDVMAGIEYLKKREEINDQKIGLIGHSEGGIIAPMVAVKSSDVAFVVLLAGTGLTGEEILHLQSELISRAMGSSEEEIAKNYFFNDQVYSLVKKEENDEVLTEKLLPLFRDYFSELSEDAKNQIGDQELFIKAQLQSLLSPWFKFFLTYDPKPTLSRVKCPVLALNGEKDLQVPPKENLSAIKEGLLQGGNTNFLIKELPGLNHLFQTAQTGSPEEYAKIEETISAVALTIISDWILEQTVGDEQRYQ